MSIAIWAPQSAFKKQTHLLPAFSAIIALFSAIGEERPVSGLQADWSSVLKCQLATQGQWLISADIFQDCLTMSTVMALMKRCWIIAALPGRLRLEALQFNKPNGENWTSLGNG